MRDHVISVDVGTASVRAGVFGVDGHRLAKAEKPITLLRPSEFQAEYRSTEIWESVCQAVREALAQSGLSAAQIAAIGFDATCSLVVLTADAKPLSIAVDGADGVDTIAWMDHRAVDDAQVLNGLDQGPVLQFGSGLSPEMQLPKLRWIKRELPQVWSQAGLCLDLADFLTFKATGSTQRSVSTLASKWSYQASVPGGWQGDLLEKAGLADMTLRCGLEGAGLHTGARIGSLTDEAAKALGLDTDCLVGPGLVDAYAGVLAVLGPYVSTPERLPQMPALVSGTSSALLFLTPDQPKLTDYWGPYDGVALPQVWLTEGGQSASGALLDHIVRMHASGGEPTVERHQAIAERVAQLRQIHGETFGADLHVLADFHGDRSPKSDARVLGSISGLSLDTSFDGLCQLYWRAAVGLACGMAQIVQHFRQCGFVADRLHLAGGHVHNPLLVELYADATGLPLIVPEADDCMLLGTAMAAAVTAGLQPDLATAGRLMVRPGRQVLPDPHRQQARARDGRALALMRRHRSELAALGPEAP